MSTLRSGIQPSAYRNPSEGPILFTTLLLVGLAVLVTASVTFCAGGLFILVAFGLAYYSSRAHHRSLMHSAYPVSAGRSPQLHNLAQECATRLNPGPLEVFVVRSQVRNAYTFGLEAPKVVVLYSALLEIMDADELRFIIGHEMGHVSLGHTWLNSMIGGLAGIPTSSALSATLTMVFLGWNRACEFSADRAGLLACGKPEKAITALIKLVAGPQALTPGGLQQAYSLIDSEDDTLLGNLAEVFGTHPLIIKRITALRNYARSAEYRRLLARLETPVVHKPAP